MSSAATDMMHAFERVFGAKFTDMAWRSEMSVWGKCWHECSNFFADRLMQLETTLAEKNARIHELENKLQRATGGFGK